MHQTLLALLPAVSSFCVKLSRMQDQNWLVLVHFRAQWICCTCSSDSLTLSVCLFGNQAPGPSTARSFFPPSKLTIGGKHNNDEDTAVKFKGSRNSKLQPINWYYRWFGDLLRAFNHRQKNIPVFSKSVFSRRELSAEMRFLRELRRPQSPVRPSLGVTAWPPMLSVTYVNRCFCSLFISGTFLC